MFIYNRVVSTKDFKKYIFNLYWSFLTLSNECFIFTNAYWWSFQGYIVTVRESGGDIVQRLAPSNKRLTVSGLLPATIYVVAVAAYNSNGKSDDTRPVSITTGKLR